MAAGGLLYAFLLTAGFQIERNGNSDPWITILLSIILALPIGMGLRRLFEIWQKMVTGRPDLKRFLSDWQVFLVLTACYIPMYIVLFPGSFAYDVPFQVKQVITGIYSSHHPVLHTLLLGIPVALGKKIGHVTWGTALYTLIQILLLSRCFSKCVESIEKQSGKRSARAAMIFFAIYPLHMLMASNATKDTLFGGTFALAFCLILQKMRIGVTNRENGRMILAILFSILLRNNAVYAYLAWTVLLMLILKDDKRKVPVAVLASTILALFAGACLNQAVRATPGDIVEMLSVPIQQVARVRNLRPEVLSEEEIEAIDAAMPSEAWSYYDPTISDPVKFAMDSSVIRENPKLYLKLYLSVLLKCPKESIDAFLLLTHGFLYPYQHYEMSNYYLQTGITVKYYDGWWTGEPIHTESPTPELRAAIEWRIGSKGAMQWPVIGYLFNIGVIIWIMLLLALKQMYFSRKDIALAALLPVFLLGTYLLGPCVAGRYVYPFVCLLPILAQKGNGGKWHET